MLRVALGFLHFHCRSGVNWDKNDEMCKPSLPSLIKCWLLSNTLVFVFSLTTRVQFGAVSPHWQTMRFCASYLIVFVSAYKLLFISSLMISSALVLVIIVFLLLSSDCMQTAITVSPKWDNWYKCYQGVKYFQLVVKYFQVSYPAVWHACILLTTATRNTIKVYHIISRFTNSYITTVNIRKIQGKYSMNWNWMHIVWSFIGFQFFTKQDLINLW